MECNKDALWADPEFWEDATAEDVGCLLDNGANPNALFENDETPLHYAAHWCANPEVVASLLKSGADINAVDADGKTPLRLEADRDTSRRIRDQAERQRHNNAFNNKE